MDNTRKVCLIFISYVSSYLEFDQLINLNRNLRNNLKFYVNHIPCKVAAIQDTQAVDVVKHFYTNPSSDSDFKSVYSIERTIYSTSNEQYLFDNEQSFVSGGGYFASISSLDISDIHKSSDSTSFSSKTFDHNSISKKTGMSCKMNKKNYI